jgi:hypothetical protein
MAHYHKLSLPENVVPLTRSITSTQCLLPNNTILNISRSQVEVLPNFAMTDYTFQGKTRVVNVQYFTLPHILRRTPVDSTDSDKIDGKSVV